MYLTFNVPDLGMFLTFASIPDLWCVPGLSVYPSFGVPDLSMYLILACTRSRHELDFGFLSTSNCLAVET